MISGASIVVRRLAEGLAGRGHQVLVLAASDRGPAYLREAGGLRVARLRSVANPLRVGQRAALFPLPEVREALRRFQPDVVHAHDPVSVGLAALLAARELRRPTALTLHQLPWFIGPYLPFWARPLRQPVEQALWRYAGWLNQLVDQTITPSQTIAALVRAQGVGAPLAISNGVDLERFSPAPASPEEGAALRRQYGLDPDLPILLHVGRLDADKQVGQVVRAAALVLQQTPAQLLIVGDGVERAQLEALAATLGLTPHVRFTGYIADTGDLPGLYRLARAFVTASEVEIQSSVVLEAAAAGLPTVAVRASSMPEYVREGHTGYLVPPGRLPAMADRLVALLRDPALARAFGHAARALAEHHSPVKTLEGHEMVYQRLRRRVAV